MAPARRGSGTLIDDAARRLISRSALMQALVPAGLELPVTSDLQQTLDVTTIVHLKLFILSRS